MNNATPATPKPTSDVILVMYRYEGPEPEHAPPDAWNPVHRDDVPGWIKQDPDVIAKMMRLQIVNHDDEPDIWYRAEFKGHVM